MSDINAQLPASERPDEADTRDSGIGLLVLLAVGLAVAAVALAMLNRDVAEPYVLAVLGGLSVIGVFALFAGAVGLLRFSERTERDDLPRSLLDHLPYGALVTTPRGRVVYANEAYHRIIGMPEEAGTPTIEQHFSGDPRVSEKLFRLARAARQGNAGEEEFPHAVADDTAGDEDGMRWFRVSVRQVPLRPGRGGRSAHTLWLVDDITGERRREDSAFASLQQMVDYLDHAPAGFLSAEPSGAITYMNATMARWLGHDLSAVADGKLTLGDVIIGDTGPLTAEARSAGTPIRTTLRRK